MIMLDPEQEKALAEIVAAQCPRGCPSWWHDLDAQHGDHGHYGDIPDPYPERPGIFQLAAHRLRRSRHDCLPGWTYDAAMPDDPNILFGKPPVPGQYPRGAVWDCYCGDRWVSRGETGLRRGWRRAHQRVPA
jgi:hypothetical protein